MNCQFVLPLGPSQAHVHCISACPTSLTLQCPSGVRTLISLYFDVEMMITFSDTTSSLRSLLHICSDMMRAANTLAQFA